MNLPVSKFHTCCTALFILLLFASSVAAQTDAATTRATAERLLTEAGKLRTEGSRESLQQAIQKLAAAEPLFHALNDRSNEAFTFLIRGLLYDDLGEKQKALDYYNQ